MSTNPEINRIFAGFSFSVFGVPSNEQPATWAMTPPGPWSFQYASDSSTIPEEVIDMVVIGQDVLDKPGGREFAYLMKAELVRDGRPEYLIQKVSFRAGDRITVDFTAGLGR